jgi:hypothetical protein
MSAADLAWPAYIVAIVAVMAIGVLQLLARGRPKPAPPTLREKINLLTDKSLDARDDREDHWALAAERSFDRRQRMRRTGKVTPIHLSSDPTADPVQREEGFVLDRSSRGFSFASERSYEVGAVVFVLPTAPVPDIAWVEATVRNCRAKNDYFVIGCEFKQTPPWGVLLLFG